MPAKLTIEEMREIAQSRGGECLSDEYVNAHTKLRWKCAAGHEWEAPPMRIKNAGGWCPQCAGETRREQSSTRLTIEIMRQIASSRGGECLSGTYASAHSKLRWKCAEGHEWEATPSNIRNNKSWCPACVGVAKLTIESMREIARAHGGKCLSETYVSVKTKLRWKCVEDHEWEAIPSHIKGKGSWCPICAGKAKHTIEEMHELAISRGGECLSDEYVDANTKLRWKCAKGHKWEAVPSSVKNQGTWCPVCGGSQKLTIEEMHALASVRGGKCLSDEYANMHTKLRWRCAEGHEWDAASGHIKHRKQWCPTCSGTQKLTIEEMHALADARGGKCLSDEYTNAATKLRWKCAKGHEWEAVPGSVRNGNSWCPCCRFKNEQVCRETFETLTQKNFAKCKPKWLQGLELDGYCEELGIAFEYQGEQHYEIVAHWHKNGEEDLKAQQARDAKKEHLCDENWITLIVIPCTVKNKRVFIDHELGLLLP